MQTQPHLQQFSQVHPNIHQLQHQSQTIQQTHQQTHHYSYTQSQNIQSYQQSSHQQSSHQQSSHQQSSHQQQSHQQQSHQYSQNRSLQQRIDHLLANGISTPQMAKRIAARIFNSYNRNGTIHPQSISDMMVDAYKSINKGFQPSNADIISYSKILDIDRDQNISLQDLEQVCYRYLVGPQKISIKK